MQKLSKIFKSIEKWLIVILLLFIPLYQKFPLIRIKSTFVSIRLEDILILLAVLIWVTNKLLDHKLSDLLKSKMFFGFLIFFSLAFLSTFCASFVMGTVNFKLALLHLIRRIELMILFFVSLDSVRDIKRAKLFYSAMIFSLVVVNIFAIGQKYLHFPAVSTTNSELSKGKVYFLGAFDRVNSTFAGHYDLAVFLMASIVMLTPIFIFLAEKAVLRRIKIKETAVTLILISVSFAVLVLTAARLSFVSLVLGVFIGILILKRYKYLLVAFAILLLAVVVPSSLQDRLISTITINIQRQYTGYEAVSESQEERSKLNIPTLPSSGKKVETTNNDSADITPGEPTDITSLAIYRSFEIRTKVEWPRAIRAFYRNPLLGSGYSSIGLATDSDILRSLGEVGVLGTFAFGLFIFAIFKNFLKYFSLVSGLDRYILAGIVAMIVAFISNGLFIDVFEASKVASLFWMSLGITLGYLRLKRETNKLT